MKKLLSVILLATLLLSASTMFAGAKVISGRALDENWILDRDNFVSDAKPDNEANYETGGMDDYDTEAFQLAPYYKMQYTLDTETGELNIFCGIGDDGQVKYEKMLPYAKNTWVPWMKSAEKRYVKKAVIADGVLSVGRYSFYDCDTLEELYIPHSVRKVDRNAVYNCDNLKTVYYAGTAKDFFYVLYDEVRNGVIDPVTEEMLVDMRDLIHFGESVGVVCKNQDGQTIQSYTVGGYFPGDAYSITPPEIEGLEYRGKESEITGKFKEADDTVYVFEYFCEHEYIVTDPSKPCGSFCKHCGQVNPDPETPHKWAAPEVKSERGMLTPEDYTVTCHVCKASYAEYKQPYIFYVAIVGSALVIAAGVALAIILPIRHKKKMRDMTW
jgi:hypothetical protein